MGFCFSGLFLVVDSWLNESAHNDDRARLMSIYRIVDLSAVTGMQFLIPLVGTDGFALFIITGMLLMSLSGAHFLVGPLAAQNHLKTSNWISEPSGPSHKWPVWAPLPSA